MSTKDIVYNIILCFSLILYPYLKSLCDLKVDKAGAEDIGEDHLECLPVLKPGVKVEALNADRLAVLDFQGLEARLQGLKVKGKHQVGAGVDQDSGDLKTHWHYSYIISHEEMS